MVQAAKLEQMQQCLSENSQAECEGRTTQSIEAVIQMQDGQRLLDESRVHLQAEIELLERQRRAGGGLMGIGNYEFF